MLQREHGSAMFNLRWRDCGEIPPCIPGTVIQRDRHIRYVRSDFFHIILRLTTFFFKKQVNICESALF